MCRGEAGEGAVEAGAPPWARCPQLCPMTPCSRPVLAWPISGRSVKGSAGVLRQSGGSDGGV